MTTEIIKNYENAIQNTKLRNFTEQIYKQGLNIKKSFARVAAILVKIDESKCYEQDGFTSVQDYAEKFNVPVKNVIKSQYSYTVILEDDE